MVWGRKALPGLVVLPSEGPQGGGVCSLCRQTPPDTSAPTPPPSILEPSVQTVCSLSLHPAATSRTSASFPKYALPWMVRILLHSWPSAVSFASNPITTRSFSTLFRVVPGPPPVLPSLGSGEKTLHEPRLSVVRSALAGVSALFAATLPSGLVRKVPAVARPMQLVAARYSPSIPFVHSRLARPHRARCPG